MKYLADIALERESLVFDENYNPVNIEYSLLNQNITKDFADNQVEYVTDIFCCPKEIFSNINEVIKKSNIPGYLWPFSMPGNLSFNIEPAKFEDNNKVQYREYLLSKYSKELQVLSGIHLNLSYKDDYLKQLFASSNKTDFEEFKSELYFNVLKKLYTYLPFIVLYTSSSPYYNSDYKISSNLNPYNKNLGFENSIGLRNSIKFGYSNERDIKLNFDSLNSYTDSIKKMITDKTIISEKELYTKIRLKSSKGSILKENTNYIEIRCIDINPFHLSGLSKEMLDFIYFIFMHVSTLPDVNISTKKYNEIMDNIDLVAINGYDLDTTLNIDGQTITIKDYCKSIFNELRNSDLISLTDVEIINDLEQRTYNKNIVSHKVKRLLDNISVHDAGIERMWNINGK